MGYNPNDTTRCYKCGKLIKKGKHGRLFCSDCDRAGWRLGGNPTLSKGLKLIKRS